jgi:hypothetical protein
MSRALHAHLQGVLYHIMSADCYQGRSSTPTLVAASNIPHSTPIGVNTVPPADEQAVLKTCKGC